MNFVALLGASAWGTAAGLHALGTALTLRQLSEEPPHLDAPFGLYPVTVLKPLKGADCGIRENLESFFALDYPRFELLFSVADADDPAVPLVRELMTRYPNVRARLVLGDVHAGPNPKVNNLLTSYGLARYDWVLIADSNVRVPRNYLKRLVAHLDNDTGIVTSIVSGRDAEGWGGLLEATYLNTFYARGTRLAFWAGRPLVIGKSMLFRRSTADRFGGMRTLAGFLAEDYVAGEAIRHLGLKVRLARDPVDQHIGPHSFVAFWQRHLRWGRIRKAQAPLTFLAEPLATCFPAGLIGAVALASSLGVSFAGFFLAHLAFWAICDLALMRRLGQAPGPRAALAWGARELLHLPLWLQTAAGNSVTWRGRRMRVRAGGMLET